MFRDKTFIGLNIAVFLMMLGVGMIVALLPQRIITLTGTGATVGYLASAFAISYILFQLPIGYLSDRLGFKPLLLAGYILCFITGAVYYLSASANSIFLGRMIQGMGEAPVWALAPALLSIKYPLNKGQAMGFYNASLHTGLTIGPILGIILSKEWMGNQPFLFYALACLSGAIILFFTVENVSPVYSSQKNSMTLKELKLL
ncbi:MAG: MFS transporter, partial [Syntrophomonadaceae bacterium]|nr:MFS transporter [Syntrophomonadaceae bacterium]